MANYKFNETEIAKIMKLRGWSPRSTTTVVRRHQPIAASKGTVGGGFPKVPPPPPPPAASVVVTPASSATPPPEFLPPGAPLVAATPTPAAPPAPSQPKVLIPARLQFLQVLGPMNIIAGIRKMGGTPYIAFLFPRTVVLECEEYGNALFFFENRPGWETLAEMPRADLIRQRPVGYIGSLRHQGRWQSRVQYVIPHAALP